MKYSFVKPFLFEAFYFYKYNFISSAQIILLAITQPAGSCQQRYRPGLSVTYAYLRSLYYSDLSAGQPARWF